MIRIKPGVEFAVVAPAGYAILSALKETSTFLAIDLTITSGTDGTHHGPTDPHYSGQAYDVRSHDLSPLMKGRVLTEIFAILGHEKFSGRLESPGTPDEHFHIQRRIGTTWTVQDFLNS